MITIRKGKPEDEAFIVKHAYRLVEFGPPQWRKKEEMTPADIKHITTALSSGDPNKEILIAEDSNGNPCGFLHMTLQTDYYTGEIHAHITDIVVAKEAEGKGIGKFLLEKADQWALEKKSRWITLNAFEGNTHARAVYEKAGYQQEWIKYLKRLDR
jgi:GNAT superfamily N-acetyltransferase